MDITVSEYSEGVVLVSRVSFITMRSQPYCPLGCLYKQMKGEHTGLDKKNICLDTPEKNLLLVC